MVNHLIPEMKPYAGHATDKLVLIFAARHAHPAGCGITVTRDTLAGWLGCEERTVSVSLGRLRRNGYMVIDGREAHGGYRHRIILCQRCRVDTAEAPCQRCPTPPAAAPPSRPSAVSSRHPNRELQVVPEGTPLSGRSRPAASSPKGDGRTEANHRNATTPVIWPHRALGAGPVPAPWNPPTARRQAAECAFKPSNQAREARASAILPFKADGLLACDHGNRAHRTTQQPRQRPQGVRYFTLGGAPMMALIAPPPPLPVAAQRPAGWPSQWRC